MAQVFQYPPAGANPSIGTTGITAPTSATEVGGIDNRGRLKSISVDSSGNVNTNVLSASLPTGAATEAKQDTGNTSLSSIDSKIVHVDTGDVTVSASALPTGAATEAKQDTGNSSLSSIDGKIVHVDTGAVAVTSSALPTGAATSANQATEISSLASIDGKITAVNTGNVTVSASALPTGAATSAKQDTGNTALSALNARMAGALVPAAFDYIALTYVPSGNGAGQVQTATYKTGGSSGTVVATLTLVYDSGNDLISVTKS